MKYIDADKLKTEIERLYYNEAEKDESILAADAYKNALDAVEKFITSLQQEQKEVDLEKEVKQYFQGLWPGMETVEQCNTDLHFTPLAIMRLATHFYELGLNARKEE